MVGAAVVTDHQRVSIAKRAPVAGGARSPFLVIGVRALIAQVVGIAAYLSLAVVFAVFAVEGAAVVVAVRMWRQRKRPGASRVGLTVGAVVGGTVAVIAAASVFATATRLLMAFGAVGGESVDPTQKARILAQGISEAMNYTALSMLVALPLAIGLLIYAFVRDRRSGAVTS